MEHFELNTGEIFDLENFSEGQEAPLKNYKKANSNIAASTAMLASEIPDISEDPAKDFDKMEEEFASLGRSPTQEQLSLAYKQANKEADKQLMQEVLLQEDIPLEEKKAIVDGYNRIWEDTDEPVNTLRELVNQDQATNPHPYEIIQDYSSLSPEEVIKYLPLTHSLKRYKALKESQDLVNSYVANMGADAPELFGDLLQQMIPFLETKFTSDVLEDLGEGSSLLLGENKEKLKKVFEEQPTENIQEFTEKLLDAVDKNSDDLVFDQNTIMSIEALRTATEKGYYEDFDKLIDNTISVLDVLAIPGTIVRTGLAGKRLLKGTKAGDVVNSKYEKLLAGASSWVTTGMKPLSVLKSAAVSNWEKARGLNTAARNREDVAEALHGGTSSEVAMGNIAQPKTSGGYATPSPKGLKDIEDFPEETQKLLADMQKSGRLDLTEGEVAQIVDKVGNVLRTSGLNVGTNNGLSTLDMVDGKIQIRDVVTFDTGGWLDPKDALEDTKFALRDLGVVDSDLSFKIKDETGLWKDSSIEEINSYNRQGVTPEIGIQITKNYDPSVLDIGAMESFSAPIWFNKMFNGKGAQWALNFIPHNALIGKNLFGAFSTVFDRGAKTAQDVFKTFKGAGELYKKLPDNEQAFLDSTIKKANREGKMENYQTLLNQGLSEEGIQFLREYKDFADLTYHINSRQYNKVLANKGFSLFTSKSGDTEVLVKKVNKPDPKVALYDPSDSSDTLISMTKEQLDELYESGGSVAQVRDPELLDGHEYIIVRNDGDSYLRKINESDKILSYREGYTPVIYDAPHIIRKTLKNGRQVAVATAKTIQDANSFRRKLSRENPGTEFLVTANRRDRGAKELEDDLIDLASSSYGTNQRVRGKRLEDASSGPMRDIVDDNILDPMDAFVQTVNSTAKRYHLTDAMQSSEARYIKTWGKYTGGKFSNEVLPQYRNLSGPEAVEIANMKMHYNYLSVMKSGYQNAYDQLYASVMRGLANIAGRAKGGAWLEGKLHKVADLRDPVAFATHAATTAYISLSPVRQFVLQAHTALQLVPLHPTYVAKSLFTDMGAYAYYETIRKYGKGVANMTNKEWKGLEKTTRRSKEQLLQMFDSLDDSGLLSSLNNLVNDSVSDLVKLPAYRSGGLDKAIEVGRMGFKAGEQVALASSYFTFYDKALKTSGKTSLSARELQEVAAKTRTFTGDMNRAGDMPYNKGLLKPLLQFQQVPHKMLSNMTISKQFTVEEKIKMAGYNLMMFSLPTAWVYDMMGDDMPEDGFQKDVLVEGVYMAAVNAALSAATGEEVGLSSSGLAPLNAYGMYELYTTLILDGPTQALLETPVVGLGNKILDTVKFGVEIFQAQEGPEMNDKLLALGNDVLSLASGYSYFYKAQLMSRYEKALSAKGVTIDQSTSMMEAVAQIAGIRTQDAEEYYLHGRKKYEMSKEFYEDLDKAYDSAHKLLSVDEKVKSDRAADVVSVLLSNFSDNPVAMRYFMKKAEKDMKEGDAWIGKYVVDSMWQAKSLAEWESLAVTSGLPKEQIAEIKEMAEEIIKDE